MVDTFASSGAARAAPLRSPLGRASDALKAGHNRATVAPSAALLSILGFWLFYMVVVTIRSLMFDTPIDQTEMAWRRLLVVLAGIGITGVLYFILRMFDDRPLGVRIAAAFILALPGAVAISFANLAVFAYLDPANLFNDAEALEQYKEDMARDYWVYVAQVTISRYFFLACWATLYLALGYAGEVRGAERRAARFAQAAQAAELRSLRYQVNPHFLFNTLNSLSTLVLRDRPEEAEQMIMNLSTFFRTSLSGDPLEDVPLSEEVHLQRLYLDIEAVRFPERLRTEIIIPDDLQDACVPGLILQPLVENAIKYGVSRASRPVMITIVASADDDVLTLTVTDDGDVLPSDEDKGSGIGLANVRDRLETCFGFDGQLIAGPRPEGGFRAVLTLPLMHQGC